MIVTMVTNFGEEGDMYCYHGTLPRILIHTFEHLSHSLHPHPHTLFTLTLTPSHPPPLTPSPVVPSRYKGTQFSAEV